MPHSQPGPGDNGYSPFGPLPGSEKLTPRELECLLLLDEGKTDSQIASTLSISVNTVRTHIKSIWRKLGIGHRGRALLPEARQRDAGDRKTPKNTLNGD